MENIYKLVSLAAWREMLPLKVARVKPGKVCAGVPATLPVAVAPMLAHYALRMHNTELLSMICAGHARLSSDRIAIAMVVRLVTTKNITTPRPDLTECIYYKYSNTCCHEYPTTTLSNPT